MKRLVLFLAILALAGSAPSAGQPDAAMSLCTLDFTSRLLLVPNGLGDVPAATFTVTVNDAAGIPIPGAVVTVFVGGVAGGFTRICAGEALAGVTDAFGVVAFNIGGGGCYKAADAVVILAAGIPLRVYGAVMSPDYTATDNVGIPGRSSLTVNPSDLAAFVAAYQGGGGPASCHDYNNNGRVDVPDLAAFASSYRSGTNFCP